MNTGIAAHFAKLLGSDSHQAAKDAGEMALGLEADIGGHFDQSGVPVAKKLLGALDSLAHNVLVRSGSGAHFEELGEVVLAHADDLRHLSHAEVLLNVLLHMLQDPLQAARRQASNELDRREGSTHVGVDDFLRAVQVKGLHRQDKNVHAFRLRAGEGRKGIVAQSGPDTWHAIGGHRRSDAASGNDDASFSIAAQNRQGHLLGIVAARMGFDS